jgi:hypothetical protein
MADVLALSPRSLEIETSLDDLQLKVLDMHRCAEEHFHANNFSASLKLLDDALLLLPDTPHLIVDRIRSCFALEKYDECISLCEQVIENGRKRHTDFELLGQALSLRDASLRSLDVPPNLPEGFVLAPPGKRGRFVTCTSPFAKGENLFSEAPISTIIEEEHFDKVCHGCHRPSTNLTICQACYYARFCNECHKAEKRGQHGGEECQMISRLRSLHSFSNGDISLGLCIVRIYKMVVNSQKWALDVLRLQSHRSEFDELGSDGHHYRPALMAGYLMFPPKIVDQSDEVVIQGCTPPWVHENLVTLSAIHQTNSYRFRRFYNSPPEAEGGVFLQLAMFNHSCNPNCRLESENGRLYMVALRSIQPGEEITTNYLPIIENIQERHIALRKLFFFSCDCGCDH